MQKGAYGNRLGRSFRMSNPPTLTTHTAGKQPLAVTEVFCDTPDYGFTAPIAAESSYIVGLQLRGLQRHALWLDGRPVPVRPIVPGTTHFYDLERHPIAYIKDPFHPLFFYVPRTALTELSEELGTREASDLRYRPGEFIDDPVIRHLGLSLLPALHAQRENHQLFVDHVLLALRAHLLSAYGDVRHRSPSMRGGLAPWRQRQATELMREHLVDGIPLALVAKACDLSCSAFVRAFKKSTGLSPHQWLIAQRIELALKLMRDDHSLTLADVALAAGFADQSHFTRTFTCKMGVSPGAWRGAIEPRPARRTDGGLNASGMDDPPH